MVFTKTPRTKLDPGEGPGFSHVESRTKAQRLCRGGTLERVFLMPLEFGGRDIPQNVVYVPAGIAGLKNRIDTKIIGALAADGSISRYSAAPEYRGESVVPTSIRIRAWDPREFNTQIKIWGEAIERETRTLR